MSEVKTGKVMILDHPLIQHKISILRNKDTGVKEFRELVGEIATLTAYEATRHLSVEETTIETPICEAKVKVLSGKKLALVPILRAGLGMRLSAAAAWTPCVCWSSETPHWIAAGFAVAKARAAFLISSVSR